MCQRHLEYGEELGNMADSLTEPVCLKDFESYARQYLPNHAFEFFAGGANEETTIRENVEAFKRCENIHESVSPTSRFAKVLFASVLCRSAKKRNERSLSHETKKCDAYVYTSFFQPLIRRKELGNPGGGGGLLPYV